MYARQFVPLQYFGTLCWEGALIVIPAHAEVVRSAPPPDDCEHFWIHVATLPLRFCIVKFLEDIVPIQPIEHKG